MSDPCLFIREMRPPFSISRIDILRDGGTVIFEIVDESGKVLSGTLATSWDGVPRRLTLGGSNFELPNLLKTERFALMPGGPTEALVCQILQDWLASDGSSVARVSSSAREHIESVVVVLRERLGTTESDELEKLSELKVRTWTG